MFKSFTIIEDNIKVKDGRIIDFEDVFFDDFKTEYPLKKVDKGKSEVG